MATLPDGDRRGSLISTFFRCRRMDPTRNHSPLPPPGPVTVDLSELIEISRRKAAPRRREVEITGRRLPPFVPPVRRWGAKREEVLAKKVAPSSPLLHFDEVEPDRHDHEAEEAACGTEDERARTRDPEFRRRRMTKSKSDK